MDASQVESPDLPDMSPAQRFEAIVSRYHVRVWRALRRLGVSEFDADDACQQVFLVVHRRLSDIGPQNELPFLLQTALRVASGFRRSRRRRPEDGDDGLVELADSSATPEEAADRSRTRAMLDRALAAMPTELRQVLVLFEIEELTLTELAGVLGIPRGTVASRLRRAREVFRGIVARISGTRPGDSKTAGKTGDKP